MLRYCRSRAFGYIRVLELEGIGRRNLIGAGLARFTGPIVLLTCDSIFSGGEAFVLAMKELPYVTIVGDHTNGNILVYAR